MQQIVIKEKLENIYNALLWCNKLPKNKWKVRLPENSTKIPEYNEQRNWNEDEILEMIHSMRTAIYNDYIINKEATLIFYFDDFDKAEEFKIKYG